MYLKKYNNSYSNNHTSRVRDVLFWSPGQYSDFGCPNAGVRGCVIVCIFLSHPLGILRSVRCLGRWKQWGLNLAPSDPTHESQILELHEPFPWKTDTHMAPQHADWRARRDTSHLTLQEPWGRLGHQVKVHHLQPPLSFFKFYLKSLF